MRTVPLARTGISVSRLGFGCMGMSEFYGPADDEQSLATLRHAFERGHTFFDTAQTYGNGHNEQLLGRFRATLTPEEQRRLVIATKWGIVRRPGEYQRRIDNSPETMRGAIEASLRLLGVDAVDLYYVHRIDPVARIEDTVGAMAQLVAEGKVRAIGLSEASAATLRRAHAVHPIAALQTEYSLWTRDVEAEILPTCRELGVTLVAYSPLGRGFLTGAIAGTENFALDDFRRLSPRFAEAALQQNLTQLDAVKALAARKGCTPGQLALAWLIAQGDDIVPIPGTRRAERVDENAGALDVVLTPDDVAQLDAAMPAGSAAGTRYPAEGMKGVNV